jgi:hypothetical protein
MSFTVGQRCSLQRNATGYVRHEARAAAREERNGRRDAANGWRDTANGRRGANSPRRETLIKKADWLHGRSAAAMKRRVSLDALRVARDARPSTVHGVHATNARATATVGGRRLTADAQHVAAMASRHTVRDAGDATNAVREAGYDVREAGAMPRLTAKAARARTKALRAHVAALTTRSYPHSRHAPGCPARAEAWDRTLDARHRTVSLLPMTDQPSRNTAEASAEAGAKCLDSVYPWRQSAAAWPDAGDTPRDAANTSRDAGLQVRQAGGAPPHAAAKRLLTGAELPHARTTPRRAGDERRHTGENARRAAELARVTTIA